MRQTLDPIEAEGVAVAQETAEQADVVLSVHDCVSWLEGNVNALSPRSSQKQDSQNFQTAVRDHAIAITVLNKADELNQQQSLQLQEHLQQKVHFGVSQQQLRQQQDGSPLPAQGTQLQQQSDRQLQSHELHKQQQQEQQSHDSPHELGLYDGTPSDGLPSLHHGMTSAGGEARQMPGVHSVRTVLCSCKTGWNMDVLVGALERAVHAVMQSGPESEEALVITRYGHLCWGVCLW